MARLAIRATGDKSKRENVTTGDRVIHVHCYEGNNEVHRFSIVDQGNGTIEYQSASKQFRRWYTKHVEITYYNVPSETHSA